MGFWSIRVTLDADLPQDRRLHPDKSLMSCLFGDRSLTIFGQWNTKTLMIQNSLGHSGFSVRRIVGAYAELSPMPKSRSMVQQARKFRVTIFIVMTIG